MTACFDDAAWSKSPTQPANVIRTARLTLRPMIRSDLVRLIEQGNNYAVAKNLSRFPFPYAREDAEEWFKVQAEIQKKPKELALVMALDDQLIGGIGIGPVTTAEPELGYWLGEAYWGQGYATEAAAAILDHSFSVFGLPEIIAAHFADNHASGRVLTKLGFRYTSQSQRFSRARGQSVVSLEMVLTRQVWTSKAR